MSQSKRSPGREGQDNGSSYLPRSTLHKHNHTAESVGAKGMGSKTISALNLETGNLERM